MGQRFQIALAFTCCLWTASGMLAQGQSKPAKQPSQNQQKSNGQQNQQEKGNPFPTDTTNVPVMPSNLAPGAPAGTPNEPESARYPLPVGDRDPVASPDGSAAANGNAPEQESSSDVKGLDSILPPPEGDQPSGKRGRNRSDVLEGAPQESSKEDINVGTYYLDNKNWKAALSRFQSALVLAPDEPEVYWGLAESERHLGDFANAKANYQKVIEYDPDSRHAKDAKKALKDPEISNAKPTHEGPGRQAEQ